MLTQACKGPSQLEQAVHQLQQRLCDVCAADVRPKACVAAACGMVGADESTCMQLAAAAVEVMIHFPDSVHTTGKVLLRLKSSFLIHPRCPCPLHDTTTGLTWRRQPRPHQCCHRSHPPPRPPDLHLRLAAWRRCLPRLQPAASWHLWLPRARADSGGRCAAVDLRPTGPISNRGLHPDDHDEERQRLPYHVSGLAHGD